jgi:ribonuclease P protein component
MEKKNVIRKNSEFRVVYTKGTSHSDYNLVLFVLKRFNGEKRFGVTTAKKIKKAVERNKVRRRLKEIVRKHFHMVGEGYDIVVMCRLNGKNADFSQLEKSYVRLLKKSKVWQVERRN